MKLFSTPTCPQCERVKSILKNAGKDFENQDLSDPANLAELRCLGIFTMQAPVLMLSEEPLKYLLAVQIEALSDEDLQVVVSG